MRSYLHAGSFALLAFTIATLGCRAPREAPTSLSGRRPNILFIFSDDHAPHAISAYGSKINRTPNIDRLAHEGVMFRNSFCGNSICGPSRATILTGKHCHAHGFMRNGNRFDPTQTTFPKLLQGAGYQTAIIGKWHLTSEPTGFDHWMVLPGQGQYYNPDFETPDGRQRIQGYCTDITTELALRWLREQRDPDKPFVLMCQHKAPHREWQPGPEELALFRDVDIPEPATLFDDYAGRGPAARAQEMTIAQHLFPFYDLKLVPSADEQVGLEGPNSWWRTIRRRMSAEQLALWDRYYAPENAAFTAANLAGDDLVRWKYQRYIKDYLRCVAGVDKSVGELLAYLDADPELAANTIVIYASDQGFYLGDHGWYDKRWMYEESLAMPLLVRWPGHIDAGREVEQLVQNIDYAPTFLELAGVAPPADVHGRSLVPLLEGRTPADWRDSIYYHYYESHAVHMVAAHYGIRTDRYKLIRYYEPDVDAWEMFDLENDPDEMRSVHDDAAYAEVRARLERELDASRIRYGDWTGVLGDGRFTITAGVAELTREPSGDWRLWCNALRGYALHACDRIVGDVEVASVIRAESPEGDAMLVFASGAPRSNQIRAGIHFGAAELRITRDGEVLARAPLPDVEVLDLRVAIDAALRRLSLTCGETTIDAPLPADWVGIDALGFGASDSIARFGELRITR